jgi:hypothetical protein
MLSVYLNLNIKWPILSYNLYWYKYRLQITIFYLYTAYYKYVFIRKYNM